MLVPLRTLNDGASSRALKQAPAGVLQRKCACGTRTPAGCECEACGKKKLNLQRRALDRRGEPDEIPSIVHEVLQSSGQPLDMSTRAFMEPRFGNDFSNVRVHTDSKAAQSARAVNALAYTVGHDVVFGAGQYAPHSTDSQRLLAHELAHVLQQQNVGGGSALRIGNSRDESERSADHAADAVLASTGDSARAVNQSPAQSPAPFALRRLSGPEIALTAGQVAAFRALAHQVATLVESGALAAEETALISASVAEAEAAIVATETVITTVVAATTAAEGASVATLALAADDVTIIGAVDDVAIPFTLIAAVVGFGVGFGAGYIYRNEIAAAAAKVGHAVEVMSRIVQNHVAEPKTQAQPQTKPAADPKAQTKDRQRRRRDCFQQNPGAIACDEPVFDGDDIRDEIVAEFLMDNGYEFTDLGNCTQFGAPIPGGITADCGFAPAIAYHCRVKGTANIVTIFACLCCDLEGNSHFQWSRPHWSVNLGRGGGGRGR